MTAGHRHRHVSLKADGMLCRVLRYPLYVTTNVDRVDRSRLVYGPLPYPPSKRPQPPRPDRWYLSALGILHGWTGLTIKTKE